MLLLLVLAVIAALLRRRFGPASFHAGPMWWSVLLWCVFTVYWSAAAKNSAAAKKSESGDSRRVHVLLLNVALLLVLIPVPGLRQRFLPVSTIVAVVGLAIQTAFGFLGVWARRHLGANWSGEITIKVEHELIRTGPYRFVRHPIYTAMLGMFAGSAIVSGEVRALIGLALGIIAYWRKIRLEEKNLEEAFGAAWSDYRVRTRALIPGLL